MTLKEILKEYYKVNNFLIENCIVYNTPENRNIICNMLYKELPNIDSIRCDEKNNTKDIIDENKVIARVTYFKRYGEENYYVDLVFGDTGVEFTL